jgi:hypothetical protein
METKRPTLAWLRGLRTFEWASNDRPYADLLKALVRDRAEDEQTVREMEATAHADLDELRRGEQRTEEADLERARGEVGTFRAALERAWAHRQLGEAPYDSRRPVENAQADALIQYVVRAGYGEVRTDEPEPGHFVYRVRIDWPKLLALAEAHGHPLPL